MELKFNTNSFILVKLVLQSHLYGIEICGFILGKIWCFNTPIAPLWNWNLSSIDLIRGGTDSNRTFMELKLKQYSGVVTSSMVLQSHLYGIEIFMSCLQRMLIVHSNRTFMELKYCNRNINCTYDCNSNRTFMELKL